VQWHSSDVDLRELLTQAVQTTAELFRERGATVLLDVPDAAPTLRLDADRLTQVLLNLLSNAAKFMPAEGGRVDLRLRVLASGLRVEVEDNGSGVAPGQQTLIFEKFRQGGDAAHRPQGTGLGLPISRQIVEHFGGRMWLHAGAGTGACFAFELPRQAPAEPSPETAGGTP
jgi:signal transduction histidine kinase